jgi:hypothetical protein
MTTPRPSAFNTLPDARQQAYLAIELPLADEAEGARLDQLRRYVQEHTH